VFLEDQTGGSENDLLLQSIAHGVISLSSDLSTNGGVHRRLQVLKMRGVDYIDGQHDFRIAPGGLKIYPRLIPGVAVPEIDSPQHGLLSGVTQLDRLIGGPIPWGFGVLIAGPAGAGKSSMAAQLAASAAISGKQVCMFSFEESIGTLLNRCDRLQIGLRQLATEGKVQIQRIDPSHITPGEVTHRISTGIHKENAGMVVIDSLNGYLQAMSSDKSLVVHLHELLVYLNERSVTTVLVSAQQGVIDAEQSQFEVTYLADLVIQLRYFESRGLVKLAISVVKNRSQSNERSIREFSIGESGISIGEPLSQFQGVLTGVPTYTGESTSLIENKEKDQ
jgi:circadian clock protein KaiC